jgi:hypothetical protein
MLGERSRSHAIATCVRVAHKPTSPLDNLLRNCFPAQPAIKCFVGRKSFPWEAHAKALSGSTVH